ncbi:hypothetical protein [Acholeplasma laidlawii]|uniref:Uncharacterized protein n=2 Tax=Acholeplasma laidlawii TaxID=2148 RepID=A9NFR6_ACHLI|nr:hypothetical protein [Acholeplasma laidlawii]ABX81196.1 hypothetical protein ACL_0579 [Acholeplasma laidlawii PG-8A]NWH10232.1 hypothetical protein [Acholeplasma laidlawii]NWH11621.1 hypothetical protein [Acholeplasma laidlawii]NWH12971.1 hypothetical protein [Acholeplasma laidlawii]NWH14429.1 hypothetical protein [Acholeplasma laidlawii]
MKAKNVFSGKRKVTKYLSGLNGESNKQIDLLRLYISGALEETLKKYEFDLIEVFVDKLRNKKLHLQMNLRNQNKNIGLDFFSDYYEFCFYLAGCEPEDVENSIVKYEYNGFDLDALLKEMESKLS